MDWKAKARELRDQGLSGRTIAGMVGKHHSRVNRYFKKLDSETSNSVSDVIGKSKPRILIYDIETAPLLGYCWSLWQNNVSLNQIHSDWHVLSWAAKWLGEDTVYYQDQRNAEVIEDDYEILQGIWEMLDQADFVITQNGKKFDQKKLNARFVIHGMKPPSTYRHIDVLQITKAQFGFSSHKLQYMTDTLCKKYKKSTHAKFAGFDLWKACMEGNLEAFCEMEHYNTLDILSLEELFLIVAPWDARLPVFDVYRDDVVENEEWVMDGYVYSNLGKYERYRNTKTGQQRRGQENLLSKEKRKSLMRNIV